MAGINLDEELRRSRSKTFLTMNIVIALLLTLTSNCAFSCAKSTGKEAVRMGGK